MAATLFTAYGTTGGALGPGLANINAEDVLDLIVDVSPWETPVVTLMPKIQASSTRHEWIEDQLGQVKSRHAVSEGVAFDTAGTPTAATGTKSRVANFLQHFRYEVRVSNLQRRMNPYGIQDQYAYEVGRLVKQIGKDIEARLLEDVVIISANTFQGTESLTARMRPLSELIPLQGLAGTGAIADGVKSNVRWAAALGTGVTFASGVWDGANPLINAQTRITEAIVTKCLELVHGGGGGGGTGSADTGGGHPDTMIVSPAVFGHIGAFGGAGTGAYPYPEQKFNADVNLRKVVRAVRFYDSQFGLIEVINSRYCPQGINGTATTFVRGANPGTMEASTRNDGFVYFLERNRFRLAFARPINHIPLPPDGDSTRGMVLTDVSCELLGWRSALLLVGVDNV